MVVTAKPEKCVAKDELEMEPESKVPQSTYSLKILATIKDAQRQHGLRHGDYQRYRCYCTRRARRIKKFVSSAHGLRKRASLQEYPDTDKTAELLVALAERAWSYAMQLRSESESEPRKRFHSLARLKKCVSFCAKLMERCSRGNFDIRTKLEAEAYEASALGILHFELRDWVDCMRHFEKAKAIYEKLAEIESEDATLYAQRGEEFSPNLRFCAYNIEKGTTTSDLLQLRASHGDFVKNLDVLLKLQESQEEDESLHRVKWQGNVIPVSSNRVRAFLLADRDLEKSFANDEEEIFANIELMEQHLMDCKEASVAALNEKSSGLLNSYLQYVRLRRTVQRNLSVIRANKMCLERNYGPKDLKRMNAPDNFKICKPENVSRLYDIAHQYMMELQNLPGVCYDEDTARSINVQLEAFQALRYYHKGLEMVGVGRWDVADNMYKRALESANAALEKPESLDNFVASELKNIAGKIECSKLLVRAKGIAGTLKIDQVPSSSDGTNASASSGFLCLLPGEMKCVPCKPLFFDLAVEKVTFPPIKHKIKKDGADGAGIKGFVKGLLQWKKQ